MRKQPETIETKVPENDKEVVELLKEKEAIQKARTEKSINDQQHWLIVNRRK